jgi:hypothetical protein
MRTQKQAYHQQKNKNTHLCIKTHALKSSFNKDARSSQEEEPYFGARLPKQQE